MKRHILSTLFMKMMLVCFYHSVQPCNKVNSDTCQSNEYCPQCTLCPMDVIFRNDSTFIYDTNFAMGNEGHCPYWCWETTHDPPPEETREMRFQACRWAWSQKTPKYSTPTVNIASAEFMASTKTYIVTCSVQSMPVVPYLKWDGPHRDANKLVQFADGDGATNSLEIKDFTKDDEGIYSCEAMWAEGIAAGKATIHLNYTYVTTIQPAQSSSEQPLTSIYHSSEQSVTSSDSDESHSPQEPPSPPDISKVNQSWKPAHTAILCLVVGSVLLGMLGCWWYLNRQRWSSPGYDMACSEDDIELSDSITLETTDFENGFIHGLDSLWTSDCEKITVEKVPAKRSWIEMCKERMGKRWQCTLTTSVSMVDIPQLCWTDEVRIWRKLSNKRLRNELVKTLTMNCLQISGSFTSVTVKCPVVQNTFHVQIGELKDGKPDWIGAAELVKSGKKEFQDLKPKVWYQVRLGTREDSASQRTNWQWSATLQTNPPTFQPIQPRDQEASLQLESNLPTSCHLFITVNKSKEKELRDGSYQCQGLIPGMTQVVQLKIQEGDAFRLLCEETFCTTGTIPDGGDYEGDATTALEDFDCKPTKKRTRKQHMPTVNRCSTGLQEAINDIEESEGMILSHSIDETAFHTFVTCLQSLYKVKYHMTASCPQTFQHQDLRTVADLLVKWDLQRLCSIFDIMRRFAVDTNFSSRQQIDLARVLHRGHSRKCHLCDHALFLIERRESSGS